MQKCFAIFVMLITLTMNQMALANENSATITFKNSNSTKDYWVNMPMLTKNIDSTLPLGGIVKISPKNEYTVTLTDTNPTPQDYATAAGFQVLNAPAYPTTWLTIQLSMDKSSSLGWKYTDIQGIYADADATDPHHLIFTIR